MIVAFVGLVFVVGGTGTVLEGFGTVSGTADVERSVEIYEINYNSPIEGEESGEYVILRINTGSISLNYWNLTTSDSSDNRNNVSSSTTSEYIALIDNKTVVRNSSSELDSADIEVYDVGNLGLTNADGTENSGENVTLRYLPSSNALVHEVDYSLSNCDGADAYNVTADSCDEPMLEVSAQ